MNKFSKDHPVWAGLIGLFLLVIIVSAVAGGGSSKPKTTQASAPATKSTTDIATTPKASGPTKAERKAEAKRAAKAKRIEAKRRAKAERVAKAEREAKARAKRNTFSGTGTFVIGSDVAPGTYRAASSSGCYWARLRTLDTNNIVDNDNADGPVAITILPSDKAIETSDCSDFHKVTQAPTGAGQKHTFAGSGTFVVGTDIAPGTYRASAAPGCYWARLKSLDTNAIVDNNNADGPVVVEILPSDKAILVNDCAHFHAI